MDPILYVDRSVIRTEDRGALREAIDRLVAFVREREPQLLQYGFCLDDETSEMTVVAVHPDSASLARHLSIGAGEFRNVGRHIDLRRIDVYGDPTEAVVAQLRDKARQLGTNATVVVHPLTSGFSRLAEPGPTDLQ